MAIAFDATAKNAAGDWDTGVSSLSYTHTCTGSNLFLAAGANTYNASSITVSSVTYNSVGFTKANGITASLESSAQDCELWYLDGPATGANTLTVTFSGTASFATSQSESYTGKLTSGIESSNATQDTSGSTSAPACNVTITHTDCWILGFVYARNSSNFITAGTGTIYRNRNAVLHAIGDSNGTVSTGSQTLAWSKPDDGVNTWPGVVSLAISENNVGGGTNPKNVFGGIMFDGPFRRVVFAPHEKGAT